MHTFKHPKYYTELRKRNREVLRSGRGLAVNQAPHVSDQAISEPSATAQVERAPDPGPKQQATSYKLPGPRPISNANKGLIHKRQATSRKPQAPSDKHQAPSDKHQA
jgi:hypothetical protein